MRSHKKQLVKPGPAALAAIESHSVPSAGALQTNRTRRRAVTKVARLPPYHHHHCDAYHHRPPDSHTTPTYTRKLPSTLWRGPARTRTHAHTLHTDTHTHTNERPYFLSFLPWPAQGEKESRDQSSCTRPTLGSSNARDKKSALCPRELKDENQDGRAVGTLPQDNNIVIIIIIGLILMSLHHTYWFSKTKGTPVARKLSTCPGWGGKQFFLFKQIKTTSRFFSSLLITRKININKK